MTYDCFARRKRCPPDGRDREGGRARPLREAGLVPFGLLLGQPGTFSLDTLPDPLIALACLFAGAGLFASFRGAGRGPDAAGEPEPDRMALHSINDELEASNAELYRLYDELSEANAALAAEVEERRRAEQAARRLAEIVESSEDAIIGKTLDGTITSWNSGAERLYGYTAEEAIGRSISLIVPDDSPDELPELLRRIQAGERVRAHETVRVARDGRRVTVSLSVSPIRDANGDVIGAASIAHDITEQKRITEQLRQAQRMESIGKLAGGIAHDFNNLLTVISGNVSFLLDEFPEGDPLRADLDEIAQAAGRAADLTRSLLAFGRRQFLQPVDADLNEVVLSTDRLLRRVIGKDLEVVVLLDPRGAPARVDPGQIEQVLLNLVLNARDAMPDGGRVTIETRRESVSAADCHLAEGSYTVLEVRDTGVGIEPAMREQIFEPFFTTKPRGEGTGLGLPMALGIVQQSGGHIQVDSAPGEGTRFRVWFPAPEAAAAPEPEPAEPGRPAPAAGRETVLLVDDEEGVRAFARRVLVRAGYAVVEAHNGEEGLRLWAGQPGRIDVVLSDLEMPIMSGREMVRRITERDPAARIVYMSGYTEESAVRGGEREPRSEFIAKPFSPAELAGVLRRTLDRPQNGGGAGARGDGPPAPPASGGIDP